MPVYIVIQIFSAGGHSTRGSTRGPRGPKNIVHTPPGARGGGGRPLTTNVVTSFVDPLSVLIVQQFKPHTPSPPSKSKSNPDLVPLVVLLGGLLLHHIDHLDQHASIHLPHLSCPANPPPGPMPIFPSAAPSNTFLGQSHASSYSLILCHRPLSLK